MTQLQGPVSLQRLHTLSPWPSHASNTDHSAFRRTPPCLQQHQLPTPAGSLPDGAPETDPDLKFSRLCTHGTDVDTSVASTGYGRQTCRLQQRGKTQHKGHCMDWEMPKVHGAKQGRRVMDKQDHNMACQPQTDATPLCLNLQPVRLSTNANASQMWCWPAQAPACSTPYKLLPI